MENGSCNMLVAYNRTELGMQTDIGLGVGVASLAISSADVALLFALKLYRIVTYRLALYQVLCSALIAIALSVYPFITSFSTPPMVASFSIFALLVIMKYMFSTWLTIHIFIFAACYKTTGKLEPFYVASALLLPPTMVALYVTCFVEMRCDVQVLKSGLFVLMAVITVFVTVSALLSLLLVVIMVHRLCSLGLSSVERRYKLALRETLPFVAYPLVTLLITMPLYAACARCSDVSNVQLYDIVRQCVNSDCGIVFLLHMAVVLLASRKCQKKPYATIA